MPFRIFASSCAAIEKYPMKTNGNIFHNNPNFLPRLLRWPLCWRTFQLEPESVAAACLRPVSQFQDEPGHRESGEQLLQKIRQSTFKTNREQRRLALDTVKF